MKSEVFAKMYFHAELGQVLVTKLLAGDGNPAIKYEVRHDNNLALSVTTEFGNSDQSFSDRDESFNNMTEKKANAFASSLLNEIRILNENNNIQ